MEKSGFFYLIYKNKNDTIMNEKLDAMIKILELKKSLDNEAINYIDFLNMKLKKLSDLYSDRVDALYNDYIDQLDEISKASNNKMIEMYDILKNDIDDVMNLLKNNNNEYDGDE